jgi:glycosyltransferase involved in cell wall biosynthesis
MDRVNQHSSIRRIAFIGNYLPRQCGIATFTTDLCEAVASEFKKTSCIAVPVNDVEGGYEYPARVRFELTEQDPESYRRAADFLNINNVHMVCLQHEYGIFGGVAGEYVLNLLRELRMPVVTTLHTVLQNPDEHQLRVMKEIAMLSDRLVVMSERAVRFLQEIYDVPARKIDLIPHGIPDQPFVDPSFYKDLFGVEGKTVLFTFGLLSPNKGIENVISALPAIVARHPDVVYIVLGATHPHVLRESGEQYRQSLEKLVRERGMENNVIFCNRFVELDELIQFIGAADIYITPYLEPAQIVSGTLAYTLGAGKAVVSTPYWYAEEMLAENRGILVPFRDPQAIALEVNKLLDNDPVRHSMRKRAYLHGRHMIWPQVARGYMESFERARAEHRHFAQAYLALQPLNNPPKELPPLELDHLLRMTDETGILQHATYSVPNYREGYTTDDNARALIVSILLEEVEEPRAMDLANRYLAFLLYAFNLGTKSFRNFMNYQREWLEDNGSEDSQGRTLWALGVVLGQSNTGALHNVAGPLFEQSLLGILKTTSPRAWAFAMIGIYSYLQRFEGDRRARQVFEELAGRLLALYQENCINGWCWFEKKLTYCNAALAHGMLLGGELLQDEGMTRAGLEALHKLVELQTSDVPGGHFVPSGSNGFYEKDKDRASFDQQPVEAQAMISACLEAHRLTENEFWLNEARNTFEWFLGRNDLHQPLYDRTTGGCRDGLHPDRPNENQGAESTLAFLQSLLELKHAYENTLHSREHTNEQTTLTTAASAPVESHSERFELAVSGK